MANFRLNGKSAAPTGPRRRPAGSSSHVGDSCSSSSGRRRRRRAAAAAALAIAGVLLVSDSLSISIGNTNDDVGEGRLLRSRRASSGSSSRQLTSTPNDASGVVELPPHLRYNLAGVSLEHHRDRGTPFYWHVLKSGGTTVKDLYTSCYRMVEANEVGTTEGHDKDETLQVFDIDGARYVNVDTTTVPGIERAKRLGLVQSRRADVVFSPLINEVSSELFVPAVPGKMFTVFRDPAERIVSLFHYLQIATWEPTYNPDLASMTLEQYANSTLIESNWMVRTLVGNPSSPITPGNVELAKEIIRAKCVVGMMDHLEESLDRFDAYFGFGPVEGQADPAEAAKCRKELLARGGSNGNRQNRQKREGEGHLRQQLDPDGEAMRLIRAKNWADVILYDYAKTLWRAQGWWFKDGRPSPKVS